MRPNVVELNRNARVLLLHLYDAHVRHAGEKVPFSDDDPDLIRRFGAEPYTRAVDWLTSKGLIEEASLDSFQISDRGVEVAQSEELLDEVLPVPAEKPTASQAAATDVDVYEHNALARKLLAYLHRWHLNANGRPFSIGPNAQTYAEAGIDAQVYERAKGRLFTKLLAKPFASGGQMTIIDYGVEVAEDEDLRDRELPIAPRVRRVPDVPRDVADSLADVRATALDFVSDDDLRDIIERDLGELSGALDAGLHKSTALLAGSVAEALLVDVLDRNRSIAQSLMPGKKKFPSEASIDQLVAIATGKDVALLDAQGAALVASIRDYRDLIHPDRERRTRTRVDGATTSTVLALLRLVVRSLADAQASGRIDEYANR